MTKPMRSTEAYVSKHLELVKAVRSEPVEAVEQPDAGMYVHGLLSACASVCALPRHYFAHDDIRDIRNIRANLAQLLARLS